jgi:hypothetical protein
LFTFGDVINNLGGIEGEPRVTTMSRRVLSKLGIQLDQVGRWAKAVGLNAGMK